MRHRARLAVALAAASMVATACGTQLPDRAFDVVGSGKAMLRPAATAGGQAEASLPRSAPLVSTTSAPSTGRPGTPGLAGTSGRSVTVNGTAPGPTSGAAAGGCPGATTAGNPASDTGVTPTSIKVGTIVSGPNNPFAPNQFIVSYYGASSYFDYLDRQGGVCGRTVEFVKCDDSGDRNRDVACARKLIEQDKVFALVATNVYQYAAAEYVSRQAVPDIGGQPISGAAYYTWPHLYAIIGSRYPDDGTPPKEYWGPSGLGRWFAQHLHLRRAGVIYYAQPDSKRGANYTIGWLKAAGVQVDQEQVALLGDPSPQVQDMKHNGDQAIFDTLDVNGSAKVCRAMDDYDFHVPKVSTISAWTQTLGQALGQYGCLDDYYSWGGSTNYADRNDPQALLFRKAYSSFAAGAPLSQWSLEGWAAAMWFSDAARSCGAHLTRTCVERFVDTPKGYAGHGLLDPHTTAFQHFRSRPSSYTQCYTIVKWAGGPGGTWATVADHKDTCYTTPMFSYTAG